MKMNKTVLSVCALSLAAGVAAAQPASFTDLGVIGGEGAYTFDTINSVNTGIGAGSDTDTELGLWDSAGILLTENDDFDTANFGFWSQIITNLTAGDYYLGIGEFDSIFGDGFINTGTSWEAGETSDVMLNINGAFAGIHVGASDQLDQETAFFKVTVTPAPASMALLGLGGLVATRRRR